eukprot:9124450-Lingulodinium_polyedra.AAC.1
MRCAPSVGAGGEIVQSWSVAERADLRWSAPAGSAGSLHERRFARANGVSPCGRNSERPGRTSPQARAREG